MPYRASACARSAFDPVRSYRTIEDIHDNMKLSNQQPKPALMRTYYEKLAQVGLYLPFLIWQ